MAARLDEDARALGSNVEMAVGGFGVRAGHVCINKENRPNSNSCKNGGLAAR